MAVCDICNLEMSGPTPAISCWDGHEIVAENPDHPVWRDFPEIDESAITGDRRCPDCNVAPGGLHHSGCDQERCKVCGGQWIMGDLGHSADCDPMHRTSARWSGSLRRTGTTWTKLAGPGSWWTGYR